MKKILTILVLVLGVWVTALAVPAHPGKYRYTQPDGAERVLRVARILSASFGVI